MRIVFINLSGDPLLQERIKSTADRVNGIVVFDAIIAALNRQMIEHFAPFHQIAPIPIVGIGEAEAREMDPEVETFVPLVDETPEGNALAWHDRAPNGRPNGRVFVPLVYANGGTTYQSAESISSAMSHEMLEASFNPYVNGFKDNEKGIRIAEEVSDPPQDRGYPIDGIFVSDFVGPRWFNPADSKGPYTFMGYRGLAEELAGPFTTSEGGWMITQKEGERALTAVYGSRFPEWKKVLHRAESSRIARMASR